MMKKTLLILLIAVGSAAVGLYVGTQRLTPVAAADPAVAKLMQTPLADLSGQSHQLAEWKGKILLVNFWATWCPPCVAEMPELVALQQEMAAKNLQIIGIGIDSPAKMKEFADKHQISYPLLVGGIEGTELSRSLGNPAGGLPFTVLLDASGQMRKAYLGRLNMATVKADLAGL